MPLDEMKRGEGQGVGGERQGDAGTEICYCTQCDYKGKHDRGTPCKDLKCPVCGATMTGIEPKKYKLETKEIHNIEIFETGVWNGKKYETKDLKEIIKNYENGVIEPYLNINHKEKTTKQFADAVKAISLGFIKKLKLVGNKLVADFKQVPKQIAELIEAGALKKRSTEIYGYYVAGDGSHYNNVLEAVTFFGADGVPAVNTLSDVIKLYKQNPEREKEHENELLCLKNEDKEDLSMDEIKISKAEYDALIKEKNELNQFKANKDNSNLVELKSENESFKSEINKFKTENEDLKKTKKEFETFKLSVEKNAEEDLSTEAGNYVKVQVEAEKIPPSKADFYKSNYIKFKKEGEDVFNTFKEDIEQRAKMLPSQIKEGGKNDFEVNQEIFKDTAKMDEAINEYMQKHKCPWQEAHDKLMDSEEV